MAGLSPASWKKAIRGAALMGPFVVISFSVCVSFPDNGKNGSDGGDSDKVELTRTRLHGCHKRIFIIVETAKYSLESSRRNAWCSNAGKSPTHIDNLA
jgi:hypothetical protein